MTYKLGINTGFAVNRYPELDELIYIIKKKIGLRYIQFTADLLNPSLPRDVFNKQTKILKKACEKYDVKVISCFTGAFTRVNHFSHPNKEIRDYWKDWFKIFVDLASNLECDNIGSHLGIMSVTDCKNKYLRNERLKNNIECWHDIAKYGKKNGLKQILWEPMSIKREYGETLKECKLIQKKLNNNSPLDFRICLDVDHGDLMSKNKDDINPYKWIEEFANESSMIHLKQSLKNQFGHWPFIFGVHDIFEAFVNFWKTKLPKSNSTGKIGTQICDAALLGTCIHVGIIPQYGTKFSTVLSRGRC